MRAAAEREPRPPSRSTAPLPPPLKWAGGKRWQVPHVRRLFAPHRERRLVEPFCGGLAVALGLAPARALLNDVNPHLINFYRWLKRGPVLDDVPLENDAAAFYANRARFNNLLRAGHGSSREAAALFYYLNRTGYNGLCRFNRSGEFNVPFGRYRRINYRRDFAAYRHALAGCTFVTHDFEDLRLRPTDFVYADPPYDVEFTGYSKQGFGWHDQVRTAAWLARHPGPVVLANQATERICRLYAECGFRLTILTAPRRISCTGDRTPAREVLATRNLAGTYFCTYFSCPS
jgi:DNA adenine methylase